MFSCVSMQRSVLKIRSSLGIMQFQKCSCPRLRCQEPFSALLAKNCLVIDLQLLNLQTSTVGFGGTTWRTSPNSVSGRRSRQALGCLRHAFCQRDPHQAGVSRSKPSVHPGMSWQASFCAVSTTEIHEIWRCKVLPHLNRIFNLDFIQ